MFSDSFRSPLQGVSQQAPRDRLDGQCTAQVNLLADPVDGLVMRPPLEFMTELVGVSKDSTVYSFKYEGKEFELFLTATTAALYSITDDVQYTLSGALPAYMSDTMDLAAVSDIILISNPEVTVTQATASTSENTDSALIFCKGGVTTYTYTIDVGALNYSYTPGTTSQASGTNIITELYTLMAADTALTTNYNVAQKDNVIWLQRKNGSVPDVQVSDSGVGTDMVLVFDEVDDVADLPPYAPPDYTVTVRNDLTTEKDDYYLSFFQLVDGFGNNGTWVEAPKAGIQNEFNLNTMPHQVTIDTGAETFSIATAAWEPRRVGDETSNPTPSFVGKTINFMSAFQGRLVLLSDTAVLSRTGDPLEVYKKSATTIDLDDPIDMYNSIERPERLDFAIQFNQNLIVYSETTQFLIPGESKLTPENAAMVVSSTLSASAAARPVTTGLSVVHSYPYGAFSGMYEVFPTTLVDATQYDKITAHVSTYITGTIRCIESATNFDSLYIMSDDPRTLYVYKYLYSENKKVQSAWSKWQFDVDVIHYYVSTDKLYVTYVTDTDEVCLGLIELNSPKETSLDYTVFLDHRSVVDMVDGVFTAPYDVDVNAMKVVLIETTPGLEAGISDYNAGTGEVTTLFTEYTGKAVIGYPMYFEYIPTIPFVKDEKGVVIGTAVMNIFRYRASVRDTGSFFVDVIDTDGNTVSTREVSSNYADGDSEYDALNLFTGTRMIPFGRQNIKYNIKFYGTTYIPFNLLDLEYEFRWFLKGRRV